MDIPHLKQGHVVAVDELGVVNPATNAPDHVSLDSYVRTRTKEGAIFHTEWLAVTGTLPMPKRRSVSCTKQIEVL